jgi:predicted DNA-binding transcriptional regulator YafY
VLASIAQISAAEQVEVLLRTTIEEAREILPPVMGSLEETGDGVIFRRSATHMEWVAHVLIASDVPMEIRGPESLREMMRQIASRAAALAGS